MSGPLRCLCRRRMLRADSQHRPGDFGAPERRVTDVLLVLNAAVFLAQLATKQRLTAWGIKVGRTRACLPARAAQLWTGCAARPCGAGCALCPRQGALLSACNTCPLVRSTTA